MQKNIILMHFYKHQCLQKSVAGCDIIIIICDNTFNIDVKHIAYTKQQQKKGLGSWGGLLPLKLHWAVRLPCFHVLECQLFSLWGWWSRWWSVRIFSAHIHTCSPRSHFHLHLFIAPPFHLTLTCLILLFSQCHVKICKTGFMRRR